MLTRRDLDETIKEIEEVRLADEEREKGIHIFCPICQREMCQMKKELLNDPDLNFACGHCNIIFAFKKSAIGYDFKEED